MLFTTDNLDFLLIYYSVASILFAFLCCRFITRKYHYAIIRAIYSLIVLTCIFLWYQHNSFSVRILAFGMFPLLLHLKQEEGYCDADINSSQRDIESIGAFWARQAYDAYYKIMLRNLEERILLFEEEKGFTLSVKKLFVVCPLSCNVENIFSEKDENIKLVGNLPRVVCDQGANMNRKYFSSVYRIYPNKDVYITAQYPSPLSTLWRCRSVIEKHIWIYHRNCFIKTLKKLLKDWPCVVFLEYDDENENPQTLNSFLLSVVQEERNFQAIK